MLDEFTLHGLFPTGFLLVALLIVSGYFSLRRDPMVRPFPSHLRHT